MDTNQLIDKYGEIIAEEVNVKQLQAIDDALHIEITYHPRGDRLSGVFGKDTGRIIGAAKQGQVTPLNEGIQVTDGQDQRVLTPDQYEIRYTGLDTEQYTVEEGVIVGIDTTITPELQREGVAREVSRLLNQMRKDADYQVSDKVHCWYESQSGEIATIISSFQDYLQQEALLIDILPYTADTQTDISQQLDLGEYQCTFFLKR